MHIPEIDIQALISALTFIGAVVVAAWRVTFRMQKALEAQNAHAATVEKLSTLVIALGKRIAQAGQNTAQLQNEIGKLSAQVQNEIGKLSAHMQNEIGKLSILLTEREKDVSRVEGQIEQLSSVVIKQVAAVRDSVASMDAMWRTLQVLHPDQVPKRASDRKS